MENQTKICPFCGEVINVNAKKCKHCGEWIEETKNYIEETFITACKKSSTKPKDTKTYVEEKSEIKGCPYCGEIVMPNVKMCWNCGEPLNPQKLITYSKKENENRKNMIINDKKSKIKDCLNQSRFISFILFVGIIWGGFFINDLNREWIHYPTLCGIYCLCLCLTAIVMVLTAIATIIVEILNINILNEKIKNNE